MIQYITKYYDYYLFPPTARKEKKALERNLVFLINITKYVR
jgi:hypothetical protein